MSSDGGLYSIITDIRTDQSIKDRSLSAFAMTQRLFCYIEDRFNHDERLVELMMKAWVRALKNNDYSRFIKVYERHDKEYSNKE